MDTKTDSVAQPSPMLPEKLFGDPGDQNAVIDEFGRFWFFVKGEMRQEMIRRWNSHAELTTQLNAAADVEGIQAQHIESLEKVCKAALELLTRLPDAFYTRPGDLGVLERLRTIAKAKGGAR